LRENPPGFRVSTAGLRHNLCEKISKERSPRETEGDLQWLKEDHHKTFSFDMPLRVEGGSGAVAPALAPFRTKIAYAVPPIKSTPLHTHQPLPDIIPPIVIFVRCPESLQKVRA